MTTEISVMYGSEKVNYFRAGIVYRRHFLTTEDVPLHVTLWHYRAANIKISPKVGSMVGQRHRWWANIETTLNECLLFAGYI